MLQWLRLLRTVMHIRRALRDGFSDVDELNPDEQPTIRLRQSQQGKVLVCMEFDAGAKRSHRQ